MCLAKLKNGKNYLLRVQGLTPPTRACVVCQFELRAGLSLKKGASDKNSRPGLYRQAAVNRIESRRNRVWTGRRETRGKDATQLAVGGQPPADFPLGVRLAWLAHGRFSRPLLGEVLSPPSSDPSSATGALSFLDRIQRIVVDVRVLAVLGLLLTRFAHVSPILEIMMLLHFHALICRRQGYRLLCAQQNEKKREFCGQ